MKWQFRDVPSWKIYLMLLIRLLFYIGFCYVFNADTRYYVWWAGLLRNNGLLSCYEQLGKWDNIYAFSTIDYPIFYVLYCYLIALCKFIPIDFVSLRLGNFSIFQIFLMKIPAMIADGLIVWFIRYKLKDKEQLVKYLLNPLILFMGPICGFSDMYMYLFIILFYYYLKDNNYEKLGLICVLCSLVKPQGLYLCVFYFIYLCSSSGELRRKGILLARCFLTGYLAYIPFVLYEKDFLLPFKVYICAFKKWNFIAVDGLNIWQVWYLLTELFTKKGVELNVITTPIYLLNIGIIITIVLVCFIMLKKGYSATDILPFYFFMIFSFSMGQHGRYITYSLLCYYIMHYIKKKILSIDYLMLYIFSLSTIMMIFIISGTTEHIYYVIKQSSFYVAVWFPYLLTAAIYSTIMNFFTIYSFIKDKPFGIRTYIESRRFRK